MFANSNISRKNKSIERSATPRSEFSYSDKDDEDIFFFDFCGNKLNYAIRETENNNLTISRSPQKNNRRKGTVNNSRDVENQTFVDIRDSDCEMTISPKKKRIKVKDDKKHDSPLPNNYALLSDEVHEKSPNSNEFKKNKSYSDSDSELVRHISEKPVIKKLKKKRKKKKNLKNHCDINKLENTLTFEESFIKALTDYYESQVSSGDSKSEKNDYSPKKSKKKLKENYKSTNLNGSLVDSIKKSKLSFIRSEDVIEEYPQRKIRKSCKEKDETDNLSNSQIIPISKDKKEKKNKRERSHSGDRLKFFTSSENDEENVSNSNGRESTKSLSDKSKNKQMKSDSKLLEIKSNISIDSNGIDEMIINDISSKKKKKRKPESTLSDEKNVSDTKKKTKSKPSKNELGNSVISDEANDYIIDLPHESNSADSPDDWKMLESSFSEEKATSAYQEIDSSEILKHLTIFIPFAIPPLHMNLRRPSRPGTDEIIASKDMKVKCGPYSQEEDEIIRNNWKRFCLEHNLNIEPSVFFKLPRSVDMEEKIKFLQYISHGLEDRMPHRVHFRFKILFGNSVKKTGRFTEQEDQQIMDFMEVTSSKKPFTDLAQLLNRPSNSIERRYKILNRLNDDEKIFWTPSKAEKLIECMLDVRKLEKPEQLEDCKFSAKHWRKISRRMEGISVRKLQRAWQLTIYPRLFAIGDCHNTKKNLLAVLSERQENDWRLVDWKDISKNFPGYSPEKLYMLFKKLVIYNVPKHKQDDLSKCIEHLKAKHIATSHKFRKYTYRNGHLVYEDESEDDEDIKI